MRWYEAERCFKFVAMYKGKAFHRPMVVTPFDFYELCFGKQLTWNDPNRPYDRPCTLGLRKNTDGTLFIATSNQFHYEIVTTFSTIWPVIDFADFYKAAKEERGCKPERDWHFKQLAAIIEEVDAFTEAFVNSKARHRGNAPDDDTWIWK